MSSTTLGEDESRICVAVRCRPLSDTERNHEVFDVCRIMDRRLVILLDPGAASNGYLRHDKSKEKRFAFDQAFGADTDNGVLFSATAEPLIDSVLAGLNCSVFAYGATGAGKTFTMIGTPAEPGVMFRTVAGLFARSAPGQDHGVSVACSFVEVYNEVLRDLGSRDGREGMLDLREDPITGPSLAGVTEIQAQSVQQVMELLQQGNQRRTTEPTAMNVTSSRSHAVFQVRVERRDPKAEGGGTVGKLSMIDLAGSERASQTHNSGLRLLEGANINRSLLALGNCINALASGSGFVPFRDSKLTRLLKDSLGGNCRTMMIANISPSHLSYEDTLNTLKYANRAKNIRVSTSQNLIQPDDHVRQYEHAISDLRQEAALLKAKLVQRAATQQLQDLEAEKEVGGETELKEASENWKLEIIKNLESRSSLQRSLLDVEKALVQWRVELDHAKEVIAYWEDRQHAGTPGRPRLSAEPQTLEEWKDLVSQIEENMNENAETRRSLARRLQQNKEAGKELQAQLPRRVLNEDLRAFLELVQRVQVLEYERLELDHFWEIHRRQLEDRDLEIVMLREQLRLRNDHILAQRKSLPSEPQGQLGDRAFLLGATSEMPVQDHGPLRIMQAWAPGAKETDEFEHWDNRPLRQRERTASCDGQVSPREASELERCLSMHDKAINWRALEVPLASQIKGIASLQEDRGKVPRLLANPPLPQASVPPPPGISGKPGRHLTSLAAHGVAPAPVHTARRPHHAHAEHRSPPPMRTGITSDASLAGRPLNRGVEARSPALHSRHGVLRAYGVSPAYRELHRDQRQMDRNGAQHRKSSPWRSRGIGKAGKFLVHMPGR